MLVFPFLFPSHQLSMGADLREERHVVLLLWRRLTVRQPYCSDQKSNPPSPTGSTSQRPSTVKALYERLDHYHFILVRHLRIFLQTVSNIVTAGSRDAGQRQIHSCGVVKPLYPH